MSNELARMAPMPTHNMTGDPLWRKLWNTYEPVITALRRIPLVTNVEISGGMYGITAELTDGSRLWIASVTELPLDPSELEGFLVTRGHDDNPTIDEVVYDSTQDGQQPDHGNNFVPLIQAIAAFVTERSLAPTLVDLVSVQISRVTGQHTTLSKPFAGPLDDHREAVKQYGYATHELMENGWVCIHEQGGTEWPLTFWVRNGEVATVYLAYVGCTPRLMDGAGEALVNTPEESGQTRCNCVIAHAQNDAERATVQTALDNALAANDARGVLVACLQLMQPCPARGRGPAR